MTVLFFVYLNYLCIDKVIVTKTAAPKCFAVPVVKNALLVENFQTNLPILFQVVIPYHK